MSCGTDGDKKQSKGSLQTQAPGASGAAITPPPASLAMLVSKISRQARRRLWNSTVHCPVCNGRIPRGSCGLCGGSGNVTWDGVTIPHGNLSQAVTGHARQGVESQDGYLWIACHFPELATDPDVQRMIRREVAQYPERALLGYGPDTLAQAGMTDLLKKAAYKNPDAARASLRALEVLGKQSN